jgi:hypothetical protein
MSEEAMVMTEELRREVTSVLEPLAAVQEKLDELHTQATKTSRAWNALYWIIGLSSVIVAAIAGAAGLAELISAEAAGAIALLSGVLSGVDKYIGAGGKAGQWTKNEQDLASRSYLVEASMSTYTRSIEKLDELPAGPPRDQALTAQEDAIASQVKEAQQFIARYLEGLP